MSDNTKQQANSELSQVFCRARAEKGLSQGHTKHPCTTEVERSTKGTCRGFETAGPEFKWPSCHSQLDVASSTSDSWACIL